MADAAVSDALQTVSEANSLFTSDIYKVLAQQEGNLFFSPWSIQIILALAFLGAGGNTAKEMASGLRLPEDKNATEQGLSDILSQMKDVNDITLRVANKMFVKKNFAIYEAFKQSAGKLMAGVEEMDFVQGGAAEIINSWVEKITNGKIKNIIPSGAFSELTRMVLVNAVYFKGNWSRQFTESATRPELFYPASQPAKNVDTMFIKDRFSYALIEELNCQALLLPYKGRRISMLILLPRELNGLLNAENKLADVTLQQIMSRMYWPKVIVHLPKFKMEYQVELTETLKKLGMTSMFSDYAANFSGISEEKLKVNQVLHKAFIEVNEEGTEAAAATAVIGGAVATSLHNTPPPPIIFRADHPFLFYILDQKTKVVLFAGRVSDP
ncbi:serpin B6-like [Schistocerca piceifrons]|uniref:serpin B6-like n=1 Tax=Schistocerca piceifrons TaxID=274613 RepID=UPI001F5E5B0C|nr:serpin B6-like [Schistocerca piceifrons]